MLGSLIRSSAARVALWTVAISYGICDVAITHDWGRAGLYILGGAMCLTMRHTFHRSISTASVAAYVKGREHRDRTEQTAQVFTMGRRN